MIGCWSKEAADEDMHLEQYDRWQMRVIILKLLLDIISRCLLIGLLCHCLLLKWFDCICFYAVLVRRVLFLIGFVWCWGHLGSAAVDFYSERVKPPYTEDDYYSSRDY